MATGGAWVFYFADAPTLARELVHGQAPLTAYAFIGILTFTTYSLGGLMREQVCTYMCPWPRIQGAMLDDESLSVTYRTDRGEPRGPHKKGQPWEGRGDCIDCNQCVVVCPMGIDIRDGDAARMHQLRAVHRRLRRGDGQGRPAQRADRLRHRGQYRRRMKGEKSRFRFVRPRTLALCRPLALVGAIMTLQSRHARHTGTRRAA